MITLILCLKTHYTPLSSKENPKHVVSLGRGNKQEFREAEAAVVTGQSFRKKRAIQQNNSRNFHRVILLKTVFLTIPFLLQLMPCTY